LKGGHGFPLIQRSKEAEYYCVFLTTLLSYNADVIIHALSVYNIGIHLFHRGYVPRTPL
jgi:hypothetical protein